MTKEGSGSPDVRQGLHEEYDELGVVCPPHTTEKKLVARIDLRLLPFISLLYLLAFLDRVNIANAKSFGLLDDLKLGGVEYNTILTIFFVPCKFWHDYHMLYATRIEHLLCLLTTEETRRLLRNSLQHPP